MSSGGVRVRAVDPSEYERVGELTVAAYAALRVDHLFGGYDEHIRAVGERCESTEVLVAELDGRVVGAVTYASDPESPWLEWNEPGEAQIRLLAVDTDAQGHGIGEALVRACIERAREQGLTILLHTTNHMPTAQRLYPRMGFTRRPDRDVHEFEAEHDMTFLAFTYEP
ncbi:MAG TPA: GNAT family N-acetyltransferase [Acidimicrobiia bacterium]|nr:GNAT family N-acetyltransferase [Acidimicrobiia bacterium]